MTVWQLARSRRWLGILSFAVVFAVACVWLGQWQFARRAEARAAITLLAENYDRSPAKLSTILNDLHSSDASLKWIPVSMQGHYSIDDVLYVRNRPTEKGIGFEQLVPFVLDTGTTFLIDRGWVPTNDDNSAPALRPELPTGEVTLVARLIPSEQSIKGRDAPAGQVATIDVAAIAGTAGTPFYTGFYGRIATEDPAGVFGARWQRPVLDEGPHLSYALQWYVFAIMGFVGYGWALRKESRAGLPIEPTPRSRRTRREQSDEDIEDEITRVR